MRIHRIAVLLPALLLTSPSPDTFAVAPSPEELARAANGFLASLSADQRARAVFPFGDAERLNWHFVPRERRGLALKEMTQAQRDAAHTLLQAGLSESGYRKAGTIMELELVLRELGGNPDVRDPDLYFFSIFGEPGSSEPWGWRAEGHHLSINFTIASGTLVATAPAFFGANPARVPSGSRQGLRALPAEEDLARELVTALDPAQRADAVIAVEAPRDIITGNAAEVDPLSPAGISVARLDAQQSALLVRLLDEYLSRMAPDLAAERRAELETTDFDRVTFAWAGDIAAGEPHYYRIQGPSFLVEYDNTQNDANHIHSVWRDFEGDFGRDLLREHYGSAPHPH
jgi:hypothetical protein